MNPAALCNALFTLVNATSGSFVYYSSNWYDKHERNVFLLSQFTRSPECGKRLSNSAIIYSRLEDLREFAIRCMIERRWLLVIVLDMSVSQGVIFRHYAGDFPLSRWLFAEKSFENNFPQLGQSFVRCISSVATPHGISVPMDWRTCSHSIVDVVQPESTRFQPADIVNVCNGRCSDLEGFADFVHLSNYLNVNSTSGQHTHVAVKLPDSQRQNSVAFSMQRTRRADVGLKLTALNYDRLSKIDFFSGVSWTYVSFYTCRQAETRAGFVGLTNVFSEATWVALGCLFAACFATGTMFAAFSDVVDVCMRMFFQQPCRAPFLGLRPAHVLITVGTFVVSSVFQQALLSHFNVPVSTALETVHDFELALENRQNKVCIRGNDYTTELISTSAQKVFQKIRILEFQNRLIRRQDEFSCQVETLKDYVISVFLDCEKCDLNRFLSKGRERLEYLISSYTVSLDFPWKKRLNTALRKLFEGDCLGKLRDRRKFKVSLRESATVVREEMADLTLQDLWPIFVILIIGSLLAASVDGVRLTWSYVRSCVEKICSLKRRFDERKICPLCNSVIAPLRV